MLVRVVVDGGVAEFEPHWLLVDDVPSAEVAVWDSIIDTRGLEANLKIVSMVRVD